MTTQDGFAATTRAAMVEDSAGELTLLRHGAVETGGERLCYGHLDLPLSAAGETQRAALFRHVLEQPRRPDRIWSSDLSRCADLARDLAAALAAPLELTPALREQHMGAWEGLPWNDLQRDHGRVINDAWVHYERWAPPGGESFTTLFDRLIPFARGVDAPFRSGRHLVVGHSGVLRALACIALDLPPSAGLRIAAAPGTWSRILFAEAGGVVSVLGAPPGSPGPSPHLDRPPRLALSGSAGVGKSTLARALSASWSVPYIPEGMRDRLEAGLDLHSLDHDGLASLIVELWQEQRGRERDAVGRAGGFVADRSSIDFLAYWLLYRLDFDSERTAALHDDLRAHTGSYDAILLLPWGALPLTHDGVRSTNRWNQLHLQATLEGLLHRLVPPERLLVLPTELHAVDDRIAWTRSRLPTPIP